MSERTLDTEWTTFGAHAHPFMRLLCALSGPTRSQNFGPSNGNDCVQQKKELSVHFVFIGTKSAEFGEQFHDPRTTGGNWFGMCVIFRL